MTLHRARGTPRRALCCAALALAILGCETARTEDKRWFKGSDKVFVRLREQDFEQIQEPDVHLDRALRYFAKDLKHAAGDELEKAAAGFAYFAQREGGAERKDLELAEHALNKLADQIRRGEVDEITTLERAVADAYRVLSDVPPKPPEPAAPPK